MSSFLFIYAAFTVICLQRFATALENNVIVYQPTNEECNEYIGMLIETINECKNELQSYKQSGNNDDLFFESQCAWAKLKKNSTLVQKTSSECLQLYPNDKGLFCHFKECYCTMMSIETACPGIEKHLTDDDNQQKKTSDNQI